MLYWYNNYGDDMNIKKLVKVALTVIIIVILGFLIKDNYYLLTNKIEYVYKKYLQGDIRQNLTDNKYRKKENYDYVKINENTTLKNRDDVKNMIYTYLDAGWDEYTVKCDADYLDCTNDIKEIVQNNTYLTDLSNFVHPFNTFDKINTTFAASGKVKLKKEPRYSDSRVDIVQNIIFGNKNDLVKYCQGIQMASPIDSNAIPEAWDMPGYSDQVIMAAGAFTQGSSIELSCDGPIREPYIAYQQGSLTYSYGRLGVMKAIDRLLGGNYDR